MSTQAIPSGTRASVPPFRQTWASVILDLVRGLAAFLVLIDHIHHLYFGFEPQPLPGGAQPFGTWFFFVLTTAGMQAVVIFFVLSGYLISGSVFRAIERNQFTWRWYLTHRLVRLWLVLLPALLIGALWDSGTVAWNAHTGLHGWLSELRLTDPGHNLTWHALFGNIFFLQTLHAPVFGSNRALWSLAYEFWYYLLFPFALFAIRKGTPLRLRLLYIALFAITAAIATHNVIALFPVWLLGTLLSRLTPPRITAPWRAVVAALYTPLIFAFIFWHFRSHLLKMDYALGLLTLAFFWIMLSAQGRAPDHSWRVAISRHLGGFSYSLYLLHYPAIFFLVNAFATGRPWPVDSPHLLRMALIALATLAYAWLISLLTERHNDAVRNWVDHHLPTGTPRQNLGGPSFTAPS